MCEDNGRQQSVYYVSKTLFDTETRYTQLEKLALALVMALKKLRPYFQSHPITVVTTFLLRIILSKLNILGRLAKWAIEHGEYKIKYKHRTSIKSHVLADFMANFTFEL